MQKIMRESINIGDTDQKWEWLGLLSGQVGVPSYGTSRMGPFWAQMASKMAYLRVQIGDIRVQTRAILTKVGPTWATPTYTLKYAPYNNSLVVVIVISYHN